MWSFVRGDALSSSRTLIQDVILRHETQGVETKKGKKEVRSTGRVPDKRLLLGAVGAPFSCDLLGGRQNATLNYPPKLQDRSIYLTAEPNSSPP